MNRAQRRHGRVSAAPHLSHRQSSDQVLRRAAALHQAGDLRPAELLYRQVLAAEPRNPDALRLLALLAHQLGQNVVAAEYLTAAAKIRPRDAQVPTDMGFVQLALGCPAEAEIHFRRALTVNPRKASALYGLGNALSAAGLHEAAVASYLEATAQEPALADAWLNLGNAYQAVHKWKEALAAYAEASRLAPIDARPHFNTAGLHARTGDMAAAVAGYRRTLELSPGHAGAVEHLGTLLIVSGQAADAWNLYQNHLQTQGPNADGHAGLAAACLALGRYDDAAEHSAAALALGAGRTSALATLSEALRLLGDVAGATAALDALQQVRSDPGLAITQATLLPVIGRSATHFAESRRRYARALQGLSPDLNLADTATQVRNAFYLPYHAQNDRTLQQQLAAAYLKAAPHLQYIAPHCKNPEPAGGRKVRVGLASAFLSDHTVGRFAEGFVHQLDRERFEVSVLHLPGQRDHVSDALDGAADHAVSLPADVRDAQRVVADLTLDTLVYPEIGMEPGAYFLSFARLAPVQAVMWGHPVTTGVPTIDYFLSSSLIEPVGAHRHYSEELVAFPRLPAYYRRPNIPEACERASFGLSEGEHVYLCPQSLFKLHPDFDAVVAAILRRDPQGRLVLLEGLSVRWSDDLRSRFRRTMSDVCGRVVFLPRMSRERFLALLQIADAMLDPLHFGGGNSSYEALGLGVPIVTLPGAFMRGRVTAGCYRQMGATDLIADDVPGYISLALRLANDESWRDELRHRLQPATSALFEDVDAVKQLEDFMVTAAARATGRKRETTTWAA